MMMEDHDMSSRLLRAGVTGTRTDAGPLAVLIVVCILFFVIWIPMLCRRRCPDLSWFRRADPRGAEREPAIVRLTLEDLQGISLSANRMLPAAALWNPIRAMSPENRREYINNVLVSREILKVSKEGPLTADGDCLDHGYDDDDSSSKPAGRKTSLLLADVVDTHSTTKVVSVEPCIICLNDYAEGDILCWSQNSKCQHFMHKECAAEWLMRHEECPLCRHNYLSLDDDDDHIDEPLNGEAGNRNVTGDGMGQVTDQEQRRGIHLFYVLSQLQNLADARPNTNFRLEGVELADGQRGVVEIQRNTEQSSTLEMGMNIRVMPLGNGAIAGQPATDREPSTFLQVPQGSSPTSPSGTSADLTEDAPGDDSPSRPTTSESGETPSYPEATEATDDMA